jgi:hypothetical protein
MTDDTLYDEIGAEADRLERIVLGELPDDDDWHDVDLEADA